MKIRGQTVYPHKERLKRLSRHNKENDCIEWVGVLRRGYGRLIVGSRTDKSRKSVTAHRLAYEVYVGKIPEGMLVLHKCDNKKCINPEHLFLGTYKDNAIDMVKKGRHRNGYTPEPPTGGQDE